MKDLSTSCLELDFYAMLALILEESKLAQTSTKVHHPGCIIQGASSRASHMVRHHPRVHGPRSITQGASSSVLGVHHRGCTVGWFSSRARHSGCSNRRHVCAFSTTHAETRRQETLWGPGLAFCRNLRSRPAFAKDASALYSPNTLEMRSPVCTIGREQCVTEDVRNLQPCFSLDASHRALHPKTLESFAALFLLDASCVEPPNTNEICRAVLHCMHSWFPSPCSSTPCDTSMRD